MKKTITVLLIMLLMLSVAGCHGDSSPSHREPFPSKLVELEKYSAMTRDKTTSIEVVYDYINGEETTYEFVIDNQGIIENIMTELFNMGLKEYPKDRDIDFYQRRITVKQGDGEYYIHLGYASDGNGNQYLCQSQKVCEIIEKYIDDNLVH